jgi:pimeloyl-ACP methyl ester carboxylesterase
VTLLADNISYTKVGTGPHLCFLHGFCEDSTIWQFQIDELQQDYTCIAIDLPGFGGSVAGSFSSIAEVATQVHTVLLREEATKCILFGHSLGGYVLAEYISLFTEDIVAAAFIHSTLGADSDSKKVNRLKSINFIAANGTKEFFRLFIKGLVALPNLGSLRIRLADMIAKNRRKSVLAGLLAMSNRLSRVEFLEGFNKPVLFLIGEKDVHYDLSDILAQSAMCSLAQVSIVKGSGHLSMLEKPEENLRVLRDFVQFVSRLSTTV